MTGATVRVVRQTDELESLSEVWDLLMQRSGDDGSIFLTPEWVSTWWKHFGAGKKLNVLLIEKDGTVIGLVPLMLYKTGAGPLTCCLLETIGSVNRNAVGLFAPESRDEAIAALFDYLEEELATRSLAVNLTLVPEDSQFVSLLRRECARHSSGLLVEERVTALAPYLSLPATWDECFGSLRGTRRRTLRRELRSLDRAHNFEFRECTDDDLDSRLRQFFDLHQDRWRSVNISGVFSDSRMKEFYADIARTFLRKKWLHFSFLDIDDRMATGEFCFAYNGVLYYFTVARDVRYAKHGIGHIHTMYLIQDAIASQLKEVDFLKGGEPYKLCWTDSYREYLQVLITSRGLRRSLRIRMVRWWLRLRELRQYGLRENYRRHLMWKQEEKAIESLRLNRQRRG